MRPELDLQMAVASPSEHGVPAAEDFQRWVRAALEGRCDQAQLTVRVVDEVEGRELNETYRLKQGPTNVLSFPFDAPPGLDLPLLGDVVICAPVVRREAIEQHKEPDAHWAHMVVHGCLHLLGYDHIDSADAELMESLETEILAGLGYAEPYEQNGTYERRST